MKKNNKKLKQTKKKEKKFQEQVSCKSWNVSKAQELETVLSLDQTKYFCQLLDYSKDYPKR